MLTLEALRATVLALLMQMPAHWSDVDEEPAARAARMTAVANDVAQVALTRPAGWEPVEVAAALLTIGWKESNFARYVGAGCTELPVHPKTKRRAPNCDTGRAHSYWQLWLVACTPLRELERGSPAAQTAAAQCAAKRFVGAYYRCRSVDNDPLVGAYAGYRSMCGVVKDTRARARYHVRTRNRLLADLAQHLASVEHQHEPALLELVRGATDGPAPLRVPSLGPAVLVLAAQPRREQHRFRDVA